VRRSDPSGGKALAALGPARADDGATATGGHAGAETVPASSLQATGLECAFHCFDL